MGEGDILRNLVGEFSVAFGIELLHLHYLSGLQFPQYVDQDPFLLGTIDRSGSFLPFHSLLKLEFEQQFDVFLQIQSTLEQSGIQNVFELLKAMSSSEIGHSGLHPTTQQHSEISLLRLTRVI